MKKYIPEKTASSRRNVPWITPEVHKMCKKKQRLYDYLEDHIGLETGPLINLTKEPQFQPSEQPGGIT